MAVKSSFRNMTVCLFVICLVCSSLLAGVYALTAEPIAAAAAAKNEAAIKEDTIVIGIQVNGKVRATIELPLNCPAADAIATAKANEKIVPFIEGKTVIKELYVKGRLVNIVVK